MSDLIKFTVTGTNCVFSGTSPEVNVNKAFTRIDVVLKNQGNFLYEKANIIQMFGSIRNESEEIYSAVNKLFYLARGQTISSFAAGPESGNQIEEQTLLLVMQTAIHVW